jgi:hypothetical protein
MWVVTVTDTQDDYKPRLFTSQEKVDRYLLYFYLDYIHDRVQEHHMEEGGKLEDHRHYFTPNYRVKSEYRTCLPEIAYILADGEYVGSTLLVDVQEVEADEAVPILDDSGEEADGEEDKAKKDA